MKNFFKPIDCRVKPGNDALWVKASEHWYMTGHEKGRS
jgi:hypothetical protein